MIAKNRRNYVHVVKGFWNGKLNEVILPLFCKMIKRFRSYSRTVLFLISCKAYRRNAIVQSEDQHQYTYYANSVGSISRRPQKRACRPETGRPGVLRRQQGDA